MQLQPRGDKVERLSDETLYDEVVMAINYLFVSSCTHSEMCSSGTYNGLGLKSIGLLLLPVLNKGCVKSDVHFGIDKDC